MKKVKCKENCGFEDEFEPDELGVNFFEAVGRCPHCAALTVYEDGTETRRVVTFEVL